MTAGTDKRPEVGDILSYCHLFANEADNGRSEGVKDRPVLVIATNRRRTLVAAVTTKGERNPNAIVLPPAVASAAGLAPGSAVVVTEVNSFDWPGFDIRPLARQAGFISGTMPPRFFTKLVAEIKSRATRSVNRN
jgi:hypothetical protein